MHELGLSKLTLLLLLPKTPQKRKEAKNTKQSCSVNGPHTHCSRVP